MSDPETESPAGPLKKFTVLRQQHAKLFVEREHLIINVKRNIVAGFQRKLGAHDHALKKAEWEVGRLKREVEMIRDSAGTGDLDYDRIAGVLEEEFDPQEQVLDEAPRQIEWANQRLNSMMTLEQTQAHQNRYRRLAELLHPEVRIAGNVTAENLWRRAREAYAAGDAPELEAIELLAEDLPPEDAEKASVEDLDRITARLKAANQNAINEIAAIRKEWPFPLVNKLPDETWVQSQREEYEQKTATLLKEREALAAELNRILDARPPVKE
jgi:BMFP domain-containing protein YqiC